MGEERVQRRLAAILAADVVGYTRLTEADEEGTIARLKRLRRELIEPGIAAHHGRTVKLMGDGALVEFPSAVDAVRCAREIQRAMAAHNAGLPERERIEFRVGINLGDIVIDGDDILGSGVNVAARLEGLAAPGGICVSEDVYRQIRGRLDVAVSGGEKRALKNVAEPVRVYHVAPSDGAAAVPPPSARPRRWGTAAAYAGFALAAGALAAVGVWRGPGWFGAEPAIRSGPALPIVAVLPFANQTGDAAQDYLADGITEDVIGGLGRFNTVRVIGRNAVLAYRNRPEAQAEAAGKLGASYVVQGSVRRVETRLRIAAQMTDARDNTVLWSNRYDGRTKNLFDFQDAITREIAGTLAARIANMEELRLPERRRPDEGAYDLVLRARAIGNSASRATNRRFRALIAEAIAKDPNYAAAHALMADALHGQATFGWAEFPGRILSQGEAYARRAIALAPDQPDGYRALGRILDARGEYDQAQSELRRAIELNPSDATALAVWGVGEGYRGDLHAAIEALERALKYDPTLEPSFVFYLSLNYYLARRHDDAIRIAEHGLAVHPQFAMFNVAAAAAAGQLGRTAPAQRYAAEIRRRLPLLDPGALGSRYTDPSYGAYLREGLARAGITSGRGPLLRRRRRARHLAPVPPRRGRNIGGIA